MECIVLLAAAEILVLITYSYFIVFTTSSSEYLLPGFFRDFNQINNQALEAKDAEIKELKNQHLRDLAEMENVRMRARKDVENERSFALTGIGLSFNLSARKFMQKVHFFNPQVLRRVIYVKRGQTTC